MITDNLSVAERLRSRIRAEGGAISVAAFMAEAVTAYYAQAEPFGVDGDFITSPEISQMFGELIGLWAATVWQDMGTPEQLHLVELGPGRGTLMVDFLRAAQVVPSFTTALDIHLVESSARLTSLQQQRLCGIDYPLVWHTQFDTVPSGPLLVIANEFLDTFPICQFEHTSHGWHERLIGIAADGRRFQFVLGAINSAPPLPISVLNNAPIGTIAESSPAAQMMISKISALLVAHSGVALFIDYGPVISTVGESLQAVRHHAPYPPLESPDKADLTAHVDFAAIASVAMRVGARVHGPVYQGEWLRRLGILTRARTILTQAKMEQAYTIITALHRLIDDSSMGKLLKVLCLTHPSLSSLPGLERN